MKRTSNNILGAVVTVAAAICFLSPAASANIKEMKAYKEAFPDAKLKCLACHAVEKPTKDGVHGLNDYGQAVIGINAKPTAETFKQAGKAEDFKK